MGKNETGVKVKFDLITASKTKKYKIITGVVLGIGVLLLVFSIFLRMTLTSAVTPNSLTVTNLSNQNRPVITISTDQYFQVSTGTPQDRALTDKIVFTLMDGAEAFLEVYDATNDHAIKSSNYQGGFWLHIRDNAPGHVLDEQGESKRPTGTLRITCGSHLVDLKFEYYQVTLQ